MAQNMLDFLSDDRNFEDESRFRVCTETFVLKQQVAFA
jgi:hypothetical protein